MKRRGLIRDALGCVCIVLAAYGAVIILHGAGIGPQ